MSQNEAIFSEAKKLIFQSNLSSARTILSDINPQNPKDIRHRDHLLGIILMREGHFTEAVAIFLKSIEKNGNHICLLLDLAACYYLSGQIQSWQRILDLAEYEYKQAQSLISWQTKLAFLLALGKMREEQGALSEAMGIYEEILKEFSHISTAPEAQKKYLQALTQLIRLKSQYGLASTVSPEYQQLIHHSAEQTDWDTAFEIEHGLFIFEAKHFGGDTSQARLQKILRNPLTKTHEASLVLADSLYEALLSGQSISTEIVQALAGLKNLSPYEENILMLSQGHQPSLEQILEWPEKMAPAAHLRLLSLCNKRKLGPVNLKRFLFLIQSFSGKTRTLWLAISHSESFQPQSGYTYDPKLKKLSLNDQVLSFKTKPTYQEILELLIQKNMLSLDKAMQILWKGDGAENDVSRLRMRVRRLNADIEKNFGQKDFILMTRDSLTLTCQVEALTEASSQAN